MDDQLNLDDFCYPLTIRLGGSSSCHVVYSEIFGTSNLRNTLFARLSFTNLSGPPIEPIIIIDCMYIRTWSTAAAGLLSLVGKPSLVRAISFLTLFLDYIYILYIPPARPSAIVRYYYYCIMYIMRTPIVGV